MPSMCTSIRPGAAYRLFRAAFESAKNVCLTVLMPCFSRLCAKSCISRTSFYNTVRKTTNEPKSVSTPMRHTGMNLSYRASFRAARA